jgi:hypothetical protein
MPLLQEHAPKSLVILWILIPDGPEGRTRLKHNVFPSHDLQHLRTYLLAEPDLTTRVGNLFA